MVLPGCISRIARAAQGHHLHICTLALSPTCFLQDAKVAGISPHIFNVTYCRDVWPAEGRGRGSERRGGGRLRTCGEEGGEQVKEVEAKMERKKVTS